MKLNCFWLRLIAEEVLVIYCGVLSNVGQFNVKPKCMVEFCCGKYVSWYQPQPVSFFPQNQDIVIEKFVQGKNPILSQAHDAL
jgi:hypothetical protein